MKTIHRSMFTIGNRVHNLLLTETKGKSRTYWIVSRASKREGWDTISTERESEFDNFNDALKAYKDEMTACVDWHFGAPVG